MRVRVRRGGHPIPERAIRTGSRIRRPAILRSRVVNPPVRLGRVKEAFVHEIREDGVPPVGGVEAVAEQLRLPHHRRVRIDDGRSFLRRHLRGQGDDRILHDRPADVEGIVRIGGRRQRHVDGRVRGQIAEVIDQDRVVHLELGRLRAVHPVPWVSIVGAEHDDDVDHGVRPALSTNVVAAIYSGCLMYGRKAFENNVAPLCPKFWTWTADPNVF